MSLRLPHLELCASGTSQFSQINVAGAFNSTALFGSAPTDGGEPPVPEPATLFLVLGGGAAMAIRRATRQHWFSSHDR